MHKAWTDDVLHLAYMTHDELPLVEAMLAKPEVCAHVFFGPNTPEQTRAYFEPLLDPMVAALEGDALPDAHIFTIREARTNTFVGECALIPVPFGGAHYTIGYQLDLPFWRRGYGTRACEFLIAYGFDILRARRLSGDTLTSNIGSMRIMERCGFTKECVQRQYYESRGKVHDNVLYRLLADERQPAPSFRPVSRRRQSTHQPSS
jgi:ribosomal-protein-alanine N-acetyltransferase